MGLHSNHSKANQTIKTIAKMNFLAITLLATGSSALSLTKDLKAASPFVNLGCQCSSLTFVDSHGQVQGNCRSVDSTGARWCYVDHLPSSCQDLSHSARFPHNPWSYEACSTPPEHSAANNHHQHHEQPSYTVPVHHVPAPVHHAPVHHAPVHHAPVHHAPVQHVPVHHTPVQHVPVHHAPAYTIPVQQPNHIHSAYTGAHQDAGPFAFKNAAASGGKRRVRTPARRLSQMPARASVSARELDGAA